MYKIIQTICIVLLPVFASATTLQECIDALNNDKVRIVLFDSIYSRQSSGVESSTSQRIGKSNPLIVSIEINSKHQKFYVYPCKKEYEGNNYIKYVRKELASRVLGHTFNYLVFYFQDTSKEIFFNGTLSGSIIASCEYGEPLMEHVVPDLTCGSF